jgi:hypothetical protein
MKLETKNKELQRNCKRSQRAIVIHLHGLGTTLELFVARVAALYFAVELLIASICHLRHSLMTLGRESATAPTITASSVLLVVLSMRLVDLLGEKQAGQHTISRPE